MAEVPLDLVGHPHQLGDPVALGNGRQDRLEVAASEDLHLAACRDGANAFDEIGMLTDQPFEQGARVMKAHPDARMPLEGFDHRQVRGDVRFLDDPPEVADGLVVVEGQSKADTSRHHRLHDTWFLTPSRPADTVP